MNGRRADQIPDQTTLQMAGSFKSVDLETGGRACPQQPIQVTVANHSFLEGDGFNIQWLLFVLGFFTVIPSIVGCFLPLCRRRKPRFPTPSYRAGWIANMVLSFISMALIIVLVVLSVVYSVNLLTVLY